MNPDLILASSSSIRSKMLSQAGIKHHILPAKIDEEVVKASLIGESASARDIADTLAEFKARKIASKHQESLVLGCDQVLSFKGRILSKAATPEALCTQLLELRGETHQLLSAAVLYHENEPIWRHIGTARLTMVNFSDTYMEDYITRNWDSIRWSVGGYKIEEEGVRLFSNVQGDHFTIMGLPLIPLLNYLSLTGHIAS